MLKQNFPSQTCREWFIKLCAWGPDFAARNEYPAIESSSELYFIVAVFPTHGLEEQLAAQQPGNWTRTSSIDIIIVMAEPWSNLTESENDK